LETGIIMTLIICGTILTIFIMGFLFTIWVIRVGLRVAKESKK